MIEDKNNYVTNLSSMIELPLRRTLVLPVLYSPLTIGHSHL
jgi:hypothetical protein